MSCETVEMRLNGSDQKGVVGALSEWSTLSGCSVINCAMCMGKVGLILRNLLSEALILLDKKSEGWRFSY